MTKSFPNVCFAMTALGMLHWASQPALADPISLTTCNGAYTQDFNTLAGWAFAESGANADTTYRAGTGSNNTGDTYSFGATGSSERAFGGLLSSNLMPLIGAGFTNNTDGTITNLSIAYFEEQWRLGQNGAGRLADRLDFQYSTDATSLTTGTWTDTDALDFSSPVTAGTIGALNGNAAANRTSVAFTITGLNIATGATFWIGWVDANLDPGSDDGLAVDDFSLTPGCDLCEGVTCPAPGPCVTYACDPGSGECEPLIEPDTTLCRSAAGECDVAENCNGVDPDCPADDFASEGQPCGSESDTECDNSDTCDGAGACQPNYEMEGIGCNGVERGGYCNQCDGAGGCDPTPGVLCGDETETACDHPDTCDEFGVCQPNYEQGGTPCGECHACDGAGGCVPEPDDTACDDDNLCTGDGLCTAGECKGGETVVFCDDPPGPCFEEGECDASTGECSYAQLAAGERCTPQSPDPCCSIYTCDADANCNPACVGPVCDDGNACTADRCGPDGCKHERIVCADDHDLCTTDTCDPRAGCVHIPIVCDDFDPCTENYCEPTRGCFFKGECIMGELDLIPGQCRNLVALPQPGSLIPSGNAVFNAVLIAKGEFEVSDVDPSSLELGVEGMGTAITPVSTSLGFYAALPGPLCPSNACRRCPCGGPDRLEDMWIRFRMSDVQALLMNVPPGGAVRLHLSGLVDGGKRFVARDCVEIARTPSRGPLAPGPAPREK